MAFYKGRVICISDVVPKISVLETLIFGGLLKACEITGLDRPRRINTNQRLEITVRAQQKK